MKKIISFWIVFLLTIVSAEAAKGPRRFYLTQDLFTGAQALTACENGYHMASIYEILDVSNFKYDTTLGLTTDDSGSGPPTGTELGWIRTGDVSRSASGIPGFDNCAAWTSESSSDSGTTVRLYHFWDSPSTIIAPWIASITSCNFQRFVWCVQD